jgi:hypothetical protein
MIPRSLVRLCFILRPALFVLSLFLFLGWAPGEGAISVDEVRRIHPEISQQIQPHWKFAVINHGKLSEWSVDSRNMDLAKTRFFTALGSIFATFFIEAFLRSHYHFDRQKYLEDFFRPSRYFKIETQNAEA